MQSRGTAPYIPSFKGLGATGPPSRTSVKYSCCLPYPREVHQHMQMMHDRTAPQIQDILPDATVAGAAALPTAHMGQGLFDGHALPPLRPSRRRRLAFPPLLHPGVIRMHPEAAARRARGTAVPPPTGPPRRCGDLDHAAGGTGDRRSAWTPPCGALPIQVQGTFGPRSYWIPGSFETSSSMSAPSNALPRFRTLCINSKNPR